MSTEVRDCQISNTTNDECIGVLDSGVGGLSVLQTLIETLPFEQFIYCADCATAPWGDRSGSFVQARCLAISNALVNSGAKAIVLACNTATALAADYLREQLNIPIIGIEPAVKPAAQATKTGVIGVLATNGTIHSPRYISLLNRFAQSVKVISQGCPGLMECVERGELNTPQTQALLETYLAPMKQAGIDQLVLGCTHYPFLQPMIAQILGPEVTLIQPSVGVSRQVQNRLAQLGKLNLQPCAAPHKFWVSSPEKYGQNLQRLWPVSIKIEALTV